MSRIVLALSILCTSLYIVHISRDVVAREISVSKTPAKLLAVHQNYPGCLKLDAANMPPEGTVFHARLDKGTELYGILCETSAYNWPYAIYLVRDGYVGEAERMFFADYTNDTGWSGTDLLFNASYDEKTGELRGFSKARGLGDCGSLNRMKWDGNQFSLMEFRYKDACDGDISKPFPLIYKRYEQKR